VVIDRSLEIEGLRAKIAESLERIEQLEARIAELEGRADDVR
jgi:hypothetical protein